MKVAVLTPAQDTVSSGYAYDLARLMGSNSGMLIFQSRGTIIPEQRATLARAAIDAGATHLLWIDSDMRFPKNSLQRLLAHGEPIVGTNYSTRRPPYSPTSETRDGYLYSDVEGLVEVSHCGFGLILTDVEVFKKIVEPYFALGFNPTDKRYVGEDFFFCKKARDAGYKILVDQELSKEVRHVGEVEFRYEHADLGRPQLVP